MSDTYTQLENICFILEPSYHNPFGINAGSKEELHKGNKNISANAKAFEDELELIYQEIILPAISGRGFRLIRSSSLYGRDKINDQYIQQIKSAKLVIANISANDPIVHYCLGYRHSLLENMVNKPEQGLFFVMDQSKHSKILDLPDEAEAMIYYGTKSSEANDDSINYSPYIRQSYARARQDLTSAIERFLLKTDWQHQIKGHANAKPKSENKNISCDENFIDELLDEQVNRIQSALFNCSKKPKNLKKYISQLEEDLTIQDENR